MIESIEELVGTQPDNGWNDAKKVVGLLLSQNITAVATLHNQLLAQQETSTKSREDVLIKLALLGEKVDKLEKFVYGIVVLALSSLATSIIQLITAHP